MANGPNLPPSYGLNDLGEYKDLGRGPVTSYFRRVVAPFVPSDAVLRVDGIASFVVNFATPDHLGPAKKIN